MYTDLFTPESLAELKTAFVTQFPMALWETFYVTVLPMRTAPAVWELDGPTITGPRISKISSM